MKQSHDALLYSQGELLCIHTNSASGHFPILRANLLIEKSDIIGFLVGMGVYSEMFPSIGTQLVLSSNESFSYNLIRLLLTGQRQCLHQIPQHSIVRQHRHQTRSLSRNLHRRCQHRPFRPQDTKSTWKFPILPGSCISSSPSEATSMKSRGPSTH